MTVDKTVSALFWLRSYPGHLRANELQSQFQSEVASLGEYDLLEDLRELKLEIREGETFRNYEHASVYIEDETEREEGSAIAVPVFHSDNSYWLIGAWCKT